MSRLLLCLLLCCASTVVIARPVHYSPDGGTAACPDVAAAVDEAGAPAAKPRAAQSATGETRGKPARPATTVRGGGSGAGRAQTPRWHSFLPGMFR